MGSIITSKSVKRIICNRKKGKFDQRTNTASVRCSDYTRVVDGLSPCITQYTNLDILL